MAVYSDGVLFQTIVVNLTDQNRTLARVELGARARKLIKFYDMAQIILALRLERENVIALESEVSSEIISDFQLLDYRVNVTNRSIDLEIHRGDASIDGNIVRLRGVKLTIANLTANKTYFIYVGQSGSVFFEEDSSPEQAAILLWKVEVKDPIQDVRFVDLRPFFTRDDRYDNVTDVFDQQVSLIRGVPNGVASLDSSGLVPLSQLPSSVKEMIVVADLAARDALTAYEFLRVHVLDATADPSVESGWAEYLWYESSWHKVSERDSLDVVLRWSNLEGKPTADPADLDDAAFKRHEHTNKIILDNLSDTNSELYYNGGKVTGNVENTLVTWAQIGVEKKTMVFVLPRTLAVGVLPLELEFPYPGILLSVTATGTTPSFFGDTAFDLERCIHSDFATTPVWTSVFQEPMTIAEGARCESAPASFTTQTAVSPRDHFRIRLQRLGYGFEGLVVQVTIQLSN